MFVTLESYPKGNFNNFNRTSYTQNFWTIFVDIT